MQTCCRVILVVLLSLSLVSTMACRQEAGSVTKAELSGIATLSVVSGLKGTIEPCGCTSKPLGGLSRVAAEVKALHGERGAPLMVVGDTFFELVDPPSERLDSEKAKAQIIRDTLKSLPVVALTTGDRDELAGGAGWRSLLKGSGIPHMIYSRVRDSHGAVDSRLITVNDVKIGLLGASGKDGVAQPKLFTEAALAIRAQGAQVVVAMVPLAGEKAAEFTTFIDAIDIAIGGGTDEVKDPIVVDGTLLLQGRNKGRELGVLEIHRRGEGGFVFDDQGAALRRTLESRIDSLREMVEAMDEGPARVARQVKLEGLVKELDTLTVKAPDGNYIRWEARPISKKGESDAGIAELIKNYNLSLCDYAAKSMSDNCTPALPGEAYVGNAVCKACHLEAFAVYEKTSHAKAWKTLEAAGKQCDVGCIQCHSVGFMEPGGPCSIKTLEGFKDVGCENCHGPGQAHVADPSNRAGWGEKFVANPTESTCLTCHTPEHSDLFKYHTYLPKVLGVGHGLKNPIP